MPTTLALEACYVKVIIAGKVDHFQDGKIKLTKNGSPDGQHHFVPVALIDHVDAHVHLNKSLADIRAATLSPSTSEAVPSPS